MRIRVDPRFADVGSLEEMNRSRDYTSSGRASLPKIAWMATRALNEPIIALIGKIPFSHVLRCQSHRGGCADDIRHTMPDVP